MGLDHKRMHLRMAAEIDRRGVIALTRAQQERDRSRGWRVARESLRDGVAHLEFLHKFKRRRRESSLARRFRNQKVVAIGVVRPFRFVAGQ